MKKFVNSCLHFSYTVHFHFDEIFFFKDFKISILAFDVRRPLATILGYIETNADLPL